MIMTIIVTLAILLRIIKIISNDNNTSIRTSEYLQYNNIRFQTSTKL